MADVQSSTYRKEDSHALLLGIVLFGDDFEAIQRVLLPAYEEHELIKLYSHSCVHTTAAAYVTELRASGLQPGSLLSGNARIKLIKAIAAASGRNLVSDRAINAAFKAYDSCSLPLLSLAEVLEQAAGADGLLQGLLAALPSCWISPGRITDLSTCLSWDALLSKLQQQPGLFESCLWPYLSAQGWQLQNSSSPVVLVPPASAAAAYHASTGHDAPSCSSPQQVLALLQQTQQPVPEECVQLLREVEAEVRIALLASAARTPQAAHRVCPDPSGRLAGLPTTRRRLMCANCSTSSTRVWRVANAGLMCCNACGMFYQKHHQHRPEHLLAANRAKHDAMQAAAGDAGLHVHTDTALSSPDGEAWSDTLPEGWLHGTAGDAVAAASDELLNGSTDPPASKRQRTRRQPQVNKRFASDEYVVLDGPLAQLHAGDHAVSSDGEACDSDGDYEGARTRSRHYTSCKLEQVDQELEGLLQRILGDRPDTSAVCEESAVATLAYMRRSKLMSGRSINTAPAAASDAVGSGTALLQQGLTSEAYAALAASLGNSLVGGSTSNAGVTAAAPVALDMAGADRLQRQQEQPLLPIAQLNLPSTASMAEVWAQLQQQGVTSHSSRDAGISSLGSFAEQHDQQSPCQHQQELQYEDRAMADWQQLNNSRLQGYGASIVIDDGAFGAISDESVRLQQQLQLASSLLDGSHYLPSAYGGSSNSSYAGTQYNYSQHDGGTTGSPVYPAQAAAAFGRQGSNNSSGSSFSMEQYSVGGSAVPVDRHRSTNSRGLAMSRFASEQRMATFNSPASPARGSPAKPRSNGKRRDGQPARCANCACESTCLWRRDKFEPQRVLCNACGIYKATNGIDRPMTAKSSPRRTIKPVAAQSMGSPVRCSDRQAAPSCTSPTQQAVTTQESLSAAQAAAAAAFPRSPKPAAPLECLQASRVTHDAGVLVNSMQAVQAVAPATNSPTTSPPKKALAVLDLSTPVTADRLAAPGTLDNQGQHAALDCPPDKLARHDGPEPNSQAVMGTMHQRPQQQQQQQEGDATHVSCIQDPGLKQQLLGVWGHAQSVQQPIVCAASGYRVYPDGSCTRVIQAELTAALPYLQRHSSSNSTRSSQDLSVALLRGLSTSGSMSNAYMALHGAGGEQGLALGPATSLNMASASTPGSSGVARQLGLWLSNSDATKGNVDGDVAGAAACE